jgi:hypothetical protein
MHNLQSAGDAMTVAGHIYDAFKVVFTHTVVIVPRTHVMACGVCGGMHSTITSTAECVRSALAGAVAPGTASTS